MMFMLGFLGVAMLGDLPMVRPLTEAEMAMTLGGGPEGATCTNPVCWPDVACAYVTCSTSHDCTPWHGLAVYFGGYDTCFGDPPGCTASSSPCYVMYPCACKDDGAGGKRCQTGSQPILTTTSYNCLF